MSQEIFRKSLHARPQHTENILRLLHHSPFFLSLVEESSEEECFHLFVPKERCLLPHQHKNSMPKVEANFSKEEVMRHMRHCKKRGLRHTLWWELGVNGSVLRSACSLSLWADYFLQTAIIQAQHLLQAQFGHIADSHFCIIGLNQLGGLELSLNGELQLLFIWDSKTATSSGPTQLDTQSYYNQLAQLVIQIISEKTIDGVAWSINMPCHLHTTSNHPCFKLEELLKHYLDEGQTWERLMLSKARPVAGNLDLGDLFIESIEPFIYRDHMDYSTIQDLADMKSDIEKNRDTSDIGTNFDVRFGRGGIHEIEFKIQSLQLMHAHRYPQLKQSNSMDTLKSLQHIGLLSETEAQDLHRSYVVWRMIEHALQAQYGEMTTILAKDYETYLSQVLHIESPHMIMKKHAKMTYLYFSAQFTSVVLHEAPL